MLGGSQPAPQLSGDRRQVGLAAARDRAKQLELVLPGAGEKRLYEGDLGWVVMADGGLYAEEFGWDETFEELVLKIVAEYASADDRLAAAWIAEQQGRRVGCLSGRNTCSRSKRAGPPADVRRSGLAPAVSLRS